MSEITRYRAPLPMVADHRSFDGDSCDATGTSRNRGRTWEWCCTRAAGHDGDHQAGGPKGQMYASWPREEAAE